MKLFFNADYALSHADIENDLSSRFDRVTIYRSLKLFSDHGLIHKVMDESAIAKFACSFSEKCQNDEMGEEHLHFKCLNCGHIYCLNSIKRNDLNLPLEYKFISVKMTAQGICKQCNQKEKKYGR